MKKTDPLSGMLRRGDPAEGQPEARTAQARRAALLAQIAAEPADAHEMPFAAQNVALRKPRWAFPVMAGAGALTAAALYGAFAWFGAGSHAPQTVPARIAQTNPRSSATPAPRPAAAQGGKTARSGGAGSVAARPAEPRRLHRRRAQSVAVFTPSAGGPTKYAISKTPLRQGGLPLPVPANTVVRTNRKNNANAPRLVTNVPKPRVAPPASHKAVEPVVERVILVLDDTPAETPPPVTSIAIAINGRAESVVVAHAAEPAAN